MIGRNTYEIVLAFDEWPYGDKPVFVLSSKPLRDAPAGAVVERLSGEAGDIVSQLAARGFEHLYIDGGITIQQFLRAGLIQRLIVTRVPSHRDRRAAVRPAGPGHPADACRHVSLSERVGAERISGGGMMGKWIARFIASAMLVALAACSTPAGGPRFRHRVDRPDAEGSSNRHHLR